MEERLKKLRRKLGYTQKEFGDQLGLSRDVISNIELGRVELKEHIAKLICKEFKVNENWLRTGEGSMFNDVLEEDDLSRIFAELSISNDEFAKRFLRTYWGLSKESKSIISNFIDMLAEKKGE